MEFLILFTISRCQTGNAEPDDETFETESYSQVNDSEIAINDDGIHNSNYTQNTHDEQEEGMNTIPMIQERAQSIATDEVDTQLPSKSTEDDTRGNITKKKRKTSN
ncbi:hypothetical protein JTB14_034808 [Gonioctena quinquepunctata]|nr:hypothetical protein JTB14_034808 [Gonioctena quinquepunctata]